jgi:hypothetical protein
MERMSFGRSVRRRGAVMVMVLAAGTGPWAAQASAQPAEVRLTRAPGRVILEVADQTVKVRKEVSAQESVATLTTGRDVLTIAVRKGELIVSGPGGTVATSRGAQATHDQLLAVLQRSEAATRARVLLSRVTDGANTFAGQSMLLTRSILELGSGSTAALTEHREWVADRANAVLRARPSGPAVIRTAGQIKGPGDCWDLYSAEAIRIAKDFEECTEDLAWYEAHMWLGCSTIYTVRAEAAMAWFIMCNGGVPFKA